MDTLKFGSAEKNGRSALKGFTLVEMIVVIAIIVILAGILSLAIQGFHRDAKIESNNEKARIIYTAFQDILINCEVTQDNSIFEGHAADRTDDILGAVVCFNIADTDFEGNPNINGRSGLGDEIHVMTKHANPGSAGGVIPGNTEMCSRSAWINGSTNPNVTKPGYGGAIAASEKPAAAKRWSKFNQYISQNIDSTMCGSYVVWLDLENYQVIEVLYRELEDGRDPKTGLFNPGEVNHNGINGIALNSCINFYGDDGTPASLNGGGSVSFPMRTYIIKNLEHEKEIADKKGVYVGCYPFGDSVYSNITAPTII